MPFASYLPYTIKSVKSKKYGKNTQSQLRDVEKILKLDPGNTELLAQKHKLLGEAVSETKEKLITLKTSAEQANQALANGDISKEHVWQSICCNNFMEATAKKDRDKDTQFSENC